MQNRDEQNPPTALIQPFVLHRSRKGFLNSNLDPKTPLQPGFTFWDPRAKPLENEYLYQKLRTFPCTLFLTEQEHPWVLPGLTGIWDLWEIKIFFPESLF